MKVERVAAILKRFGYPTPPAKALREITALAASGRDVLVAENARLREALEDAADALHELEGGTVSEVACRAALIPLAEESPS